MLVVVSGTVRGHSTLLSMLGGQLDGVRHHLFVEDSDNNDFGVRHHYYVIKRIRPQWFCPFFVGVYA